MFVTLLGGLPRPPLPGDTPREAVLDAILEVQARYGLGPLSDGGWPLVPDEPVASWQATAARTGDLVKAVIAGPRTTGRPGAEIRRTVARLADAGCAWIEIAEPAAATIGSDPDARRRFVEDHVALTEGFDGVHLSLAITGGDASAAGIETVLAGAYASLAVDLIDGPDHWYLVAAAPPTVGIICGALSARAGSDDTVELLLWASAYAASTGGRGPERVGLATAGALTDLTWAQAET